MIPGYGLRDEQFLSLVLDGSPGLKLSTAPELGNCPSQRPCLFRRENPTFHSQMSTPGYPLHQIT